MNYELADEVKSAMKDMKIAEKKPGMWNKDCEHAWRMDVDIAIGDGYDDEEDIPDEDDLEGSDTDEEE